MSDIEAQCGDAERIGPCLVQKSGSLSQSCQIVLTGLRQAVQELATLRAEAIASTRRPSRQVGGHVGREDANPSYSGQAWRMGGPSHARWLCLRAWLASRLHWCGEVPPTCLPQA
jgi:hypothetical protein